MTTRLLVTGAGGPSAVSFMNAIRRRDVDVFAGDIDPYAAGLYLVAADRRMMLRRGADPCFVDDLLRRCVDNGIDVVVPTVDSELLMLARRHEEFESRGIRLLMSPARVFERCLDKATLVRECRDVCPVPKTEIVDEHFSLADWSYPFLMKPRLGAGARGVRIVHDEGGLGHYPLDGVMVAQEYLDGIEWSVDVLCSPGGEVLAVVPRTRLKIDSGIAVAGRTWHNERLTAQARAVAEHLGITYVANIQFREDADGVAKLMDVNARFPGTMPLTIQAGIDMPCLALDLLLGKKIDASSLGFREIAIVRTWQEHRVETSELAAMEALAREMPGA